jgi:hypothetical protein
MLRCVRLGVRGISPALAGCGPTLGGRILAESAVAPQFSLISVLESHFAEAARQFVQQLLHDSRSGSGVESALSQIR